MKKLLLISAVMLSAMMPAAANDVAQAFGDAAATKPQVAAVATAAGHVAPQAEDLQPAALEQSAQTTAAVARRSPAKRAVSAADVPQSALQIDYGTTGTFVRAPGVTATLSGTTLTITNFGGYGGTITGTVDIETGSVSIPRQAAYQSSTYGQCDLVHLNSSYSSYDTTAVVTGVIEDGQVKLDAWVLYITSGTYKGYTLGTAIASSTLRATNATMTVAEIDTLGNQTSVSYAVIADQTATNMVKVLNYAGLAKQVEVGIKADSTLTIAPQLLYSITGTGNFWLRPFDPSTGTIDLRNRITGTARDRQLQWDGSIISTNSGTYLYKYASASIALAADLSYPAAATQAGWKGSGTEADPWLIETPADLIALSDSVNYATPININVGAKAGQVGRAFEGKYFKVAKNINMKDLQFNPIGGFDETYRFGGTFDGDNRTISNLTVNVGTGYNAGLFGAADTTSVIKNVKMTNPSITNTYYYTGAVVGFSQGTVENCTVTSPVISANYVTGGVAGIARVVNNLTVTGGTITGNSQTGGVVGVTRTDASALIATGTTVVCNATATTSSAGGVVGFFGGGKTIATLSDCYFSGNVIATKNGEFVGAIAGVNTEGTIERCFAVAQVGTTSSSFSSGASGGIVGGTQGGVIKDCLFTGEVPARYPNTGSIVGYAVAVHVDSLHADHVEFTNCVVSGVNRTSTTQSWAPYLGYFASGSSYQASTTPIVITNCYYDKQMLPTVSSTHGPSTTAELTSASGLSGLSTDVWTFTEGQYPALKNYATTAVSKVASAAIQLADTTQNVNSITSDFTGQAASGVTWYLSNAGQNSAEGHCLLVQNKNEYHMNGAIGIDTVVIYSSTGYRYLFVKVAPASIFTGSGTEDDPYLIRNKADLLTLCNATHANQMPYDGVHFLITNDIDVEKDEAFNGISPNGTTSTTKIYGFGGILDGGNHTIHNIKMVTCQEVDGKLTDTNTATSSGFGFVNTLKECGVVKNVRIASDCEFEFFSRSAALVGYNFGGTIENCRNYADVKAHSGTVAGITSYSAKGGVIRGCYNSGRIWASYMYSGGICATNYGVIENCQNDGEVLIKCFNKQFATSKSNSAGGIAQSIVGDGVIRNCLNTGYVHGTKYVGGILSWFNGTKGDTCIYTSISTGQVSYNQVYSASNVYLDSTLTAETIGNIVGKLYKTDVHFSGNYYDAQQNIYTDCANTDVEGIDGVTTDFLTSGQTPAGYDTTYWSFEQGRYPMLKSFADEPGAIAAAHSIVWFDGSARCDSVKRDSRLGSHDGLTWTLKSGANAFAVTDGNTLCMDPATVLTDTLVATCNGFEKQYVIVAVPDSLPTPAISVDGNEATFSCDVEGVTYYYTTDGTVPTRQSDSTSSLAELPAGELTITVVATKHNYYDSPLATLKVQVSGVADVTGAKTVAARHYVTPDGRMSSTPQQGVNVVVTRYTDGTTSVAKQVLK